MSFLLVELDRRRNEDSLLSSSSRNERLRRGVTCDSSQLPYTSTGKLDSTDVRGTVSNGVDVVGGEVDSSSSSRVV